MSTDQLARLEALGEWFAVGFCTRPEAPLIGRFAAGLRRWLEAAPLPPYTGTRLYPVGPSIWEAGAAATWHYVQFSWRTAVLQRKLDEATDPTDRDALAALAAVFSDYPQAAGYTHSIPHYGRILSEGLAEHGERIDALLADARRQRDDDRIALYEALNDLLDGIDIWRQRLRDQVATASFDDLRQQLNRARLLNALDSLPLAPAVGFFEAVAATNLIFYLDGCDDLGRLDQYLAPYQATIDDDEEAVALLRDLFANVDACSGWNCVLGGSDRQGDAAENRITLLAIEAQRGMRRPNLALRLRPDTSDAVWDAALASIAGGGGLPALYSDPNYLAALAGAGLNLSQADLRDYAFGGCTETMIQGCSNVGSLDDKLNLPLVLARTLPEVLPGATDYDALEAAVLAAVKAEIAAICDRVCRQQQVRASHLPQPMRTLLIDDCIDNGREYAAGGARYNWSVINVEGLGNLIDSLVVCRELVFGARGCTAAELLAALADDWRGHERLHQQAERCPRFGNGLPASDAVAGRVSAAVFEEFLRYAPWRGGRFLPACLMFVTYAAEGRVVPATPDGRCAGEPIADSAGAVQGRDVSGPTAALQSAAALAVGRAPGTLVVNLRLARRLFDQPAKLRALINGYFAMGGMQLQINVIDQDLLRDAVAHPERYGDLVVRMGGYSEYWSRLSQDLRESVLARTEHEA